MKPTLCGGASCGLWATPLAWATCKGRRRVQGGSEAPALSPAFDKESSLKGGASFTIVEYHLSIETKAPG